MPELQDDVREVYQMLFGPGTYEASHEEYRGNNIHRLHSLQNPPLYRPRHDIESLFWVMVDILLHAKPQRSEDSSLSRLTAFENIFKGRKYGDWDTLTALCFAHPDWWRGVLHPALVPILAELLHKLALQVGPEYEYLIVPPRSTHLHEAFRRLLLQAVVALDRLPPITLDPSRRVAPRSSSGPSPASLAHSGSGVDQL